MVMKDKLVKVGRKRSAIFNRRNFILFFIALTISASVVIPTYITVSHIQAANAVTEEVEVFNGDNSLEECTYPLTCN